MKKMNIKKVFSELYEQEKHIKDQFTCEYGQKLSIGCGCGGCSAYSAYLESMNERD